MIFPTAAGVKGRCRATMPNVTRVSRYRRLRSGPSCGFAAPTTLTTAIALRLIGDWAQANARRKSKGAQRLPTSAPPFGASGQASARRKSKGAKPLPTSAVRRALAGRKHTRCVASAGLNRTRGSIRWFDDPLSQYVRLSKGS